MKKWLYPAVFLAAAILSRLPHPAVDIARLDPVRAIYLYMDGAAMTIETDSGDSGSGADLEAAYADLRNNADREIFLDTAEFLILDPNVPITEDFYELLRPTTQVVCSAEKLSRCKGRLMETGTAFLSSRYSSIYENVAVR